MFSNNDLLHAMWVFTGGAIIVLLQSIVSETRRNWMSLLAGCVLGGIGSWVAGQVWSSSPYVYLICGAAAVATEHMLRGVITASKQFADSPIELAKQVLPMFNKGAPAPADPPKDELK